MQASTDILKGSSQNTHGVELCKLLSDETRFKIVSLLLEKGEMCVYEIAEIIGMSHSATSHQLARLENSDVVECFRDGQKMCYMLTNNDKANTVKQIISFLN